MRNVDKSRFYALKARTRPAWVTAIEEAYSDESGLALGPVVCMGKFVDSRWAR
jgi:hypothetical protein